MNLQQAGEYLDTQDAVEVEVVALQQSQAAINPAVSVPLLDLYTSKRLTVRLDELAPAGPHADESSLRFTWEYRSPEYYGGGGRRAEVVVVIADDEAQPLPDGIAQRLIDCRLSRQFIGSENVFGYKTVVKAYLPVHYPQKR